MTPEKRTILLVEDEVLIAMAQEKKLAAFGYNVITAGSGEEAVSLACGDTTIDLILMDIDLGKGIDGTEAARQILDCMDIPVVFLSSHTEPEVVEKTEKITSYGYVVKNSGPTVLATSIKMAFKLFEAKTMYNDTFSYSINGLCIHRMLFDEHNKPSDCEYISVNPAFEIHSGLSRDQLIGKTIKDIYPNNEADYLIEMYSRVFGPESFIHTELYFEPTGRWFDLSVFPMTGDFFTVAVQNITDQKKFEQALQESEKKYRTIFEHAPLGIFRSTPEGRFLEVNFELAKILGYDSPESVVHEIDSIANQIYIKGEKRREIVDEQMQKDGASHHVNHYRRRDGSEFIANLYLNTIRDDHGNPLYLEGIVEDITKKIETENLIQTKNEELTVLNEELNSALEEQQAANEELAATMEEFESTNDELNATTQSLLATQKALKESEEKFRHMFLEHHAIMLLIDPEKGSIVDANKSAENFYGYKHDELLAMNIRDINTLRPDEIKLEMEKAANEERNYFLFPHRLASGDIRMMEVYSSPVTVNGQIVLFSVIHDITERITAENALRENESRLRSYIDNAPYGVFISDETGKFLEVNPVASLITGYREEELCSMRILDLVPEDNRARTENHFTQVVKTGRADGELSFVHRDGSRRFWSVAAVRLSPNLFMGFAQDITARKQAEEDLQERMKELHCLYDISLMMMEPDISIDEVLRQTTERIPSAFRHPENTAARIVFENLSFTSENYSETRWMITSPIILNRKPVGSLNVCYLDNSGSNNSSPFLHEEKQLIAAVSERIGHIIERIRSHEELQARNTQLDLALSAGNMGTWEWEISDGRVTWGGQHAALYGTTIDEFGGTIEDVQSFVHPEDRQQGIDKYLQTVNEGSDFDNTYRIINPDGEIRWMHSYGKPVYKNEVRVSIIGTTRDITGEVLAEEALQRSEELYRMMLEKSPSGIAVINDNSKYIYANDEFCNITGYPPEEIIGKDFFVFLSDESKLLAIDRYKKRQRGEAVPDRYEFIFNKKSGERRTGEVRSAVYIDSDGHVNSMIQIIDITGRKKAEDALLVAIQEADILREKAEQATRDKDLLLKEVHHRIKNNMNTIMSLLSLQAGTVADQAASAALDDARSRVQSMMVLYDKLYRSDILTTLSLQEYLPPLVNEIVSMFPRGNSIDVDTSVDDIVLDPKKLFPIGIIVNELVTNSMKHAFTGRDSGRITVSAVSAGSAVTMTIQDDGIGLPESVHIDSSGGFGIRLVSILAEQLSGRTRIDREEGTKFTIEFNV